MSDESPQHTIGTAAIRVAVDPASLDEAKKSLERMFNDALGQFRIGMEAAIRGAAADSKDAMSGHARDHSPFRPPSPQAAVPMMTAEQARIAPFETAASAGLDAINREETNDLLRQILGILQAQQQAGGE